jgi:hypothetical protein
VGRYASDTTVPVERSRAEIEETLRKYGADEFHSGWKVNAAMIAFRLRDLFIRFVLPFPSRDEKRFTHKEDRWGQRKKLSDAQANKAYDQELRSRWRALLLVIKAKLEAVEIGISTIEREFLANIVLPSDITVGDWMMDQAIPAIKAGQMPRLLLAAPPAEPVDAEFEVHQ